jgi:hypothetical protein
VKDFREWDWDIILELFENDGVLWNQERLEHYMERTKFFKRLIRFYMPYKEMFVKLAWKQENLIYARVGYLVLKTLLKWPPGIKTLIGKQFILYLTPGAIIEDSDNPFYQKQSFIQDVERDLQSEFMKFEKDQARIRKAAVQRRYEPGQQVFGASKEQTTEVQEVATAQREMSKSKLNSTMYRELISWLGLFTSTKETLNFISKRVQQPHMAQPSDNSAQSAEQSKEARRERDKKKDETIFGYLKGLVDNTGYYDHLLQIVIHSFDFGINSSPTRDLLKEWSYKCSNSFAKSIIETYR